jgi:hypothetical protein
MGRHASRHAAGAGAYWRKEAASPPLSLDEEALPVGDRHSAEIADGTADLALFSVLAYGFRERLWPEVKNRISATEAPRHKMVDLIIAALRPRHTVELEDAARSLQRIGAPGVPLSAGQGASVDTTSPGVTWGSGVAAASVKETCASAGVAAVIAANGDHSNGQRGRHRLANFTEEHRDPHRSAGPALVTALVPVINRQCEIRYWLVSAPSSFKITSV